MQRYKAILATDLDGTLLCPQGKCSARNHGILQAVSSRPILRVVATGRSLVSVQKTLPPDFPLDVLVFSSGAGVWDWKHSRLLHQVGMSQVEATQVAEVLKTNHLSFMAHRPIPENHQFWYFENTICPPDFGARCAMHGEWAQPWSGAFDSAGATQFIVMTQTVSAEVDLASLRQLLPNQSIVRATSPWNPSITWLEIFRKGISKGSALKWLQDHLGLEEPRTFALGNDYNDIELLDWANHSRVVANAPSDLHSKYQTVVSNDQDGFYHAVTDWLESNALSVAMSRDSVLE